MARLAWGLLLSIVLVAPASDLAAKSAKRSKAPKGKERANVVSFTIATPENAGMMNTIPARIVFEPSDGISSSHLTHLGLEPKAPPKERGLVLVGGDTVELAVRPGTYSVKVITPVESQPPAPYMGHKRHVWESSVVKVVLAQGEAITLVVEAGVTGADYNGSWLIAKAAPPESQPPPGAAEGAAAPGERER